MSHPLFAPDARFDPYWWDAVPRPALPSAPLPAEVDVLVIGSGYTGLHAALQTARGGRQTLVIDAGGRPRQAFEFRHVLRELFVRRLFAERFGDLLLVDDDRDRQVLDPVTFARH